MEKQLENRKVTEQDTILLPGVSGYRENDSLDDHDTIKWMSSYILKPESSVMHKTGKMCNFSPFYDGFGLKIVNSRL